MSITHTRDERLRAVARALKDLSDPVLIGPGPGDRTKIFHWVVTDNYAASDEEVGGIAILRYGEASDVHYDPEKLRRQNFEDLTSQVVPMLANCHIGPLSIRVRVRDGKAMAFLLPVQADQLCEWFGEKRVQPLEEPKFTRAEMDAALDHLRRKINEEYAPLIQLISETHGKMRTNLISTKFQSFEAVSRMMEMIRDANLGN